MKKAEYNQLYIAGVGASAGGLEALSDFISHLPADLHNLAIIIAQHLSPTYKSRLVELLARETDLEVIEARTSMYVEPKKIYITPPDSEITVQNGMLNLFKPTVITKPKPSVDVLFHSLAAEKRNKAIGIILSGTGTDGAEGIVAVKVSGGLTISQEPQTAKYNGMPLAAIDTGFVDLVLSPDKIGEEIKEFILNPGSVILSFNERDQNISNKNESSLDKIFKLLSKRSGTDFSNYKISTISRRLEKRLSALSIKTIDAYLEYVEKNPKELDALFNNILIGVTTFFRDREAFETLEKQISKIIAKKNPGDLIRIWIAGCASGEEAYSFAIILTKILKERINEFNIQIFATDIDDKAIAVARKGVYPKSALVEVPSEIVDTYFLKKGEDYELLKSIRSMVLFSKHDITKNPPFLKLDLISCRNLLIYFGPNLQKHIIPIFHYALNNDGFLFLGKSETVGQFSDLFSTVDGKYKLYQRKIGTSIHNIKFSSLKPNNTNVQTTFIRRQKVEYSLSEMVKETLFSSLDSPYVVINDNMDVQEIKGDVRMFLGLHEGLMNANILKMAQRDLHIELRSAITKAIKEKIPIRSKIKKYEFYDATYYIRITVKPLLYATGNTEFYIVIFENQDIDETLIKTMVPHDSDPENPRIIELEQELTATKEHLQTFIEELETSNEELQSLNEELQSANEELQSSNEELETSNEELQSTNEELQIAYAELKSANELLEKKEILLNESEANTKALLNNTLQSLVLVDKFYKVITFNVTAVEHYKFILNKEISEGDSFLDYIAPKDLEKFHTQFKDALSNNIITGEISKVNDGSTFWFKYNYSPIVTEEKIVNSVAISFLDITDEKNAKIDLISSEQLMNSVFDTAPIGICVTDESAKFIKVNQGYCNLYGYEEWELIGQNFTMVLPPENKKSGMDIYNEFIKTGKEIAGEWKVQRKDGVILDVFVSASLLIKDDGTRYKVTSVTDVTESKKYRNLLLDTQEAVKVGGWELDLLTERLNWTDEIYHIFEIPLSTPIDLEYSLSFYETEAKEVMRNAIQDAIEKGEPFDLELKFITARQKRIWVRATCKPIRVFNKTIKLFGTFQDITAKKISEKEIEKLSLVASKTENGIVITDPNYKIEWANKGYEKLTGYSLDEIRGKQSGELLHGEDTSEESKLRIISRLKDGQSFSEEILNYKKNGEKYWVRMDITPIFNQRKEISNFIAIETDITEKKNTELKIKENLQEKITLLKEIHHRVKNNLQVISGLLDLQIKENNDGTDVEALRKSQQRIKTISLIHEKLYQSENLSQINFESYIKSLCNDIQNASDFKKDKVKIEVNADGILLNIKEAVPSALIINELLSNSFKHAFNKNSKGIIRISLVKSGSDFILNYSDNGKGLQEKLNLTKAKTLGMRLIKALTKQLSGKIQIQNGQGAHFKITFKEKLNSK